MSTHQSMDRICAAALALTLLLTILFANGEALGLQPASRAQGYETRLFDTARVHTIDIVMDGWEDFIETCENEEYAACAAVMKLSRSVSLSITSRGFPVFSERIRFKSLLILIIRSAWILISVACP